MATMGLLFKAVADTTRQRLLQVLSGHELSVSELVEVLRLPQSTVSRHLKTLRDAGLLVDRRVGAAVLYAARQTAPAAPEGAHERTQPGHGGKAADGSPELAAHSPADTVRMGSRPLASDGAEALPVRGSNNRRFAELREHLLEWAGNEPLDTRTAERLERLLHRRSVGGDFFERVGTRWDQLRIDAFGEAFHVEALATLLPADWTVADIGTGTGYLLPVLSAHFRSVIAIDPAAAMLDLARGRPELLGAANVAFREGSLEKLPVETGELDLAIAALVLHHVPDPADALPELRRAVKPGGRLLIIEQREHAGDEFHDRMGDHWRGFEPAALREWIEQAGFADVRCSTLTQTRPAGRQIGEVPALFALVARG